MNIIQLHVDISWDITHKQHIFWIFRSVSNWGIPPNGNYEKDNYDNPFESIFMGGTLYSELFRQTHIQNRNHFPIHVSRLNGLFQQFHRFPYFPPIAKPTDGHPVAGCRNTGIRPGRAGNFVHGLAWMFLRAKDTSQP